MNGSTPRNTGLFPHHRAVLGEAVTRLSTESGSPGWVHVVVGRRRAARVPVVAAHELGIAPGAVWTQELATRAAHAAAVLLAERRALRLLRIRSRSRADLSTRLLLAGYGSGVIDDVLERLSSAGLIDDGKLAAREAQAMLGRGDVSRDHVRRHLERRGITTMAAETAVKAAAGGRSDSQLAAAAAKTLATSQPREMSTAKRYQRLIAAMRRRGFDEEIANEAVRGVLGPLPETATDDRGNDYDAG